MKILILAATLIGLTSATIFFYPALKVRSNTPAAPHGQAKPLLRVIAPLNVAAQEQKKIEVVFVLDTTGSMSGLIQGAKDNIWSIASSIASAQSAPMIKMGLVAYRDRGEAYVTKVVDLDQDLDSNYGTLMGFQAAGGGDHAESVNKGLYDAVTKMSWSTDDDTYRVIFLVGDAPPHDNYANEMQFPEIVKLARQKGIIINTILCGKDQKTEKPWKQIAQLSQGNFFQVDQSGGTVAVTSPYDDSIAALSRQLDDTRLYYGDRQTKEAKRQKKDATDMFNRSASSSSIARKAEFNLSKSGHHNFAGSNELVTDVSRGKVNLDSVDPQQLPIQLQSLKGADRAEYVASKAHERKKLQQELAVLTKKRSVHIRTILAESAEDERSIDNQIYQTIRSQAGDKGLVYLDDLPKY